MLSESVVLSTFHVELLVNVFVGVLQDVELSVEVHVLVVFLLKDLLYSIDLHLTCVHFVLVLLDLNLGLLMEFLLCVSNAVQLCCHLLNLFGLS